MPDTERSKFPYLGNSSIAGAYLALLSERYRKEAREICTKMTDVDFSAMNDSMNEFTAALFLPHTDMKMFPGAATAAP